jgi:hypothetical protein
MKLHSFLERRSKCHHSSPSTEKEVVFKMEHNIAQGLDGLSLAELYQCSWEVIKDDLTALFVGFHRGMLTR